MKTTGIVSFVLLLASAGAAAGQQVKWNFDKLAARASDTVDVTLEGGTLRLASKFLSDEDADEAKVKKLIAGLQGIYVKGFEFANTGEYTAADIEGFRSQLRAPAWQRIVNVKSKEDGENVEVYIKNEGQGIGGLAIIAAEPKQLTLVNIVGPIDLDSLSELGGHMGIPQVEIEKKK